MSIRKQTRRQFHRLFGKHIGSHPAEECNLLRRTLIKDFKVLRTEILQRLTILISGNDIHVYQLGGRRDNKWLFFLLCQQNAAQEQREQSRHSCFLIDTRESTPARG